MPDPDPDPDPLATPIRPSGQPYPVRPPTERDELPAAGLGAPASVPRRAGARLVDFVGLSIPVALVTTTLGVEIDADTGRVEGPLWPRFVFPIVFMLYETVLIGRYGQTVGKALFRIQAVDWGRGGLASYRQAAIRAVVPGVFLLLAVLGGVLGYLQFVAIVIYLSSLADVLYRGWHDKAAATIVLSRPRPV